MPFETQSKQHWLLQAPAFPAPRRVQKTLAPLEPCPPTPGTAGMPATPAAAGEVALPRYAAGPVCYLHTLLRELAPRVQVLSHI